MMFKIVYCACFAQHEYFSYRLLVLVQRQKVHAGCLGNAVVCKTGVDAELLG